MRSRDRAAISLSLVIVWAIVNPVPMRALPRERGSGANVRVKIAECCSVAITKNIFIQNVSKYCITLNSIVSLDGSLSRCAVLYPIGPFCKNFFRGIYTDREGLSVQSSQFWYREVVHNLCRWSRELQLPLNRNGNCWRSTNVDVMQSHHKSIAATASVQSGVIIVALKSCNNIGSLARVCVIDTRFQRLSRCLIRRLTSTFNDLSLGIELQNSIRDTLVDPFSTLGELSGSTSVDLGSLDYLIGLFPTTYHLSPLKTNSYATHQSSQGDNSSQPDHYLVILRELIFGRCACVVVWFISAWVCCTLAVYWGYRRWICGWDRKKWWLSFAFLPLFCAAFYFVIQAFTLIDAS